MSNIPTAVEWLFNELDKYYQMKSNFKSKKEILNKAKEMEKQQIIDAYTHDRALLKITAEQYYEQTFNK